MSVLHRLRFSSCEGVRAILTSLLLLCESGVTIKVWNINLWKSISGGHVVAYVYNLIIENVFDCWEMNGVEGTQS